MLNRRILRAKAMQAVYAYQQAKRSNHTIASEQVKNSYLPDLNSMEFQDKDMLKQQQTLALEVFEKSYLTQVIDTTVALDEKMKNVISHAMRSYVQMLGQDKSNLEKMMVIETESIKAAYLFKWKILFKLGQFAYDEYHRERLNPEAVKNKGDLKLSQNAILDIAQKDNVLQNELSRIGLDELLEEDNIGLLYQELKVDPTYKAFTATSSQSFEEDKGILDHILRTYFFKKNIEQTSQKEDGSFESKETIPLMYSFFDAHFTNWSENRETVKNMSLRTLKKITPQTGISLLDLSPDWEGDLLFMKDLFLNTLNNEEQYDNMILDKTQNWDSSRIALVDSVIIKVAIAEMIHCYSIPVKVTINEYIEMSKKYSTPKSKEYINGILHAISHQLEQEGKIRKSGRGLIDNQ